MKVVLLENVIGLGIVGDRKEVANGYARNYLLPKKLAVKAGDSKAKILLKNIEKDRKKAKTQLSNIEKLAEKYKNKELKFELKASEKGKLFGSVGPKEVAEKLKLDEKDIDFQPLKEVGEHKVKINLGHNVKVQVKIIIKSKIKKNNK